MTPQMVKVLERVTDTVIAGEIGQMFQAVIDHHRQKADDRCVRDHDKLYAAFGLPPADYHVGSKVEMLKNCERFIANECLEGKWKSYAELEAENQRLLALVGELQRQIEGHCARIHAQSELLTKAAGRTCDECRKRQAEKATYPL